MSDSKNHDNILRSCKSRQISFVKFCNQSEQDVSIDWIDFDGRHQCYIANSKPGWQVPIKTFVGHPWMAYECRFRHSKVFSPGRDYVYFPKPSKMVNGLPTQYVINILTPMCSLEKLCLQTLHKYLNNKELVDELNLPKLMKEQLRKMFYLQEHPHLPVKIIELEK